MVIGNNLPQAVQSNTICLKNSLKYYSAEMPCILQIERIVWYAADTPAIFPLPKNKEFLLSLANGRINRSAMKLSVVYEPSCV